MWSKVRERLTRGWRAYGRKIRDFTRRHPTLCVVMAVATAATTVGVLYARSTLRAFHQLTEERKREDAGQLRALRMQLHFERNQRTCEETTLALLPELLRCLTTEADADALFSHLRKGRSGEVLLNDQERAAAWETLKELSFTRAMASPYLLCLLHVLLRVKINILARYDYLNTVSSELNAESRVERLSPQVQQQFLAQAAYLQERGLMHLLARVRDAVANTVGSLSLKSCYTHADFVDTMRILREQVESRPSMTTNGGKFSHALVDCILPPLEEEGLEGDPRTAFQILVREAREIVESEDFCTVLHACLDTAFGVLAAQMATAFSTLEGGADSEGLVPSLPLARIVPAVNKLVPPIFAMLENVYLKALCELQLLDDLCVLIYTPSEQEL